MIVVKSGTVVNDNGREAKIIRSVLYDIWTFALRTMHHASIRPVVSLQS